ncbi:MAG: polyribonucleotide nucleotidyltransferase [Candidatus Omnitrophica bacterium]|nr:polyribonucleotide nucleotidyltransferase [Candidatus Omnitrophota bacterium]
MSFSFSIPNLGRSPFTFSTGEWAKQANGSVVASYGDTVVLATVCISGEPQAHSGFVPLVVEYQEKTYAMGKIPGGFIKREGRPKDTEILSARLIDRPIRPFFPKGLSNEIQIIVMVLSSDAKNDPDVLAINAASCALCLSDIPCDAIIGAVRIGKIKDQFILNPTYEEREKSSVDFVVAATEEKIVMLEGNFNEAKEDEIIQMINFAHPYIRQIITLQKDLQGKAGKKKKNFPLFKINEQIYAILKERVYSQLEQIYGITKKEEREEKVKEVLNNLYQELLKDNASIVYEDVSYAFFALEDEFMRKKILQEEKRPGGRALNEIRQIDCKVRVLPRTHGSAIFTRGQTQSLAVTTLGTSADEQLIEALEGEKSKHFMLHYSFPPFSVGEIKPLKGPSRREIGHGALAEKSLLYVIPPKDIFPYTIRIVSEILESNGSSSMATVCASSLSLMDAGVPIKSPVAGIAIGLVKDVDRYKILTDIAGIEDHYGDMDFKVSGTRNGITALQLDIKTDGLTYQIITEALMCAKEARLFILDKMEEAISQPRSSISPYAPKIKTLKIDLDKIGNVIGPGGKTIRQLIRDNNVSIDIDDLEGTVSVVAYNQEDLERATAQIVGLTRDIQVGDIYDVKITKLTNFGAFCEIFPSKTGLIHISEISDKFVRDIRDFLNEGDIVKAKVISIDHQGKITLSIKQLNT